MEQATNLFTKGLLMDTHPMVQSNDTLTDCLNGTLITMNGNEVILQNDMGNRRVDKAFLPPGYEPVGMKEYGGVIYVAAYNPITNKSQIGSFPSPLKKLSSTNEDLYGYFNLEDFFTQYNCTSDPDLGGITVINSDSYIIPLTKNISLRAGDKFAVYSSGLSSLSGVLTNYDNTSGGNKANSPKNRTYTLLLGVLNSQNEFVDITKTLCRWKNINGTWLPVIYDEEKSDIFKFNDGYFISDSYVSLFNVDTIADALLIKERQKIAANTYSYKLVGPLYLKATLNHILNFNYNIYGLYDKDAGSATLWIEGFLTYNCPDQAFNTTTRSNGDYANFEEGTPYHNFGFDLYGDSPNIGYLLRNPNDPNVDDDKSVYNPNTNTYTVKIVRKYENITPSSIINKKFNYVIGVKADKDHNGVYIKGLSVKGTIDLSLLGSNQVKYSSWRFYNNQEEGSTLLTFAFEAYPEYGKSFGNLRFKFHDVFHGNNHDLDFYYPHDGGDLPMYNGRQTISFNWEENGFKERKIYEVTTEYNIINNKTKQIVNNTTNNVPLIVNEENSRWLLTTGLFNEFYNLPIKTPDYCNVPNNEDDIHKEFYNKMKIKYGSSSEIIDNTLLHHKVEEGSSLITSSTIDTTSIGNPIRFVYNNIYNLLVSTNVKLSINNENLYPDFIHINSNEGDNYIQINDVNVILLGNEENPSADENISITTEGKEAKYNNIFKTNLNKITGLSVSNDILLKLDEEEDKLLIKFNYNNSKNLTGYIQYNDIYLGKGEPILNISNAFDNFSNLLKMGYGHPKPGEYTGIVMNYDLKDDDDSGEYIDWDGVTHYDDGCYGNIYVEVIKNNYSDTIDGLPDHGNLFDNGERIYTRENIHSFSNDVDNRHESSTINLTEVLDGIFQAFNDAVENNNNLIFLYIYAAPNTYYTFDKIFARLSGKLGKPLLAGTRGTKVWWKMPGGQWAAFENLLEPVPNGTTKDSHFSKFVTDSLGKDIIYCMYDRYSGNAGLYAADENYAYYGRYSVPMTIKINYGFSPETTELERNNLIDTIVNIDYNDPIGNLEFSREYIPEFGFDTLELTLDSSLKFHDTINSFDTSDIKNVYINGGKNVDSSGEPLNPNYVYYFDEDKNNLVRILDNPFMVDSRNKIDGRNVLLYNFNSKNSFANLVTMNYSKYNILMALGTTLYSILYYDNPSNIVKKLFLPSPESTSAENITS